MRINGLGSCVAAFTSAALAGLTAAGCASASSSAAAAATASSSAASPRPTGVFAKLLTAADLPSGWAVDAAPSAAAGSTKCPLLNGSVWNAPLPARAEADLSKGLSGPYLVEEVATGTSAQAAAAWQQLTSGIPQCTTYTHNGAAGASTFTIGETRLPSYGDESSAFTLNVTVSGDVHASGDIVAARSGSTVLVLYVVGLTGVPQADVEDIASRAVAKARS